MSSTSTPNTQSAKTKTHLTGNKKILAAAIVIAVVSLVIKKLREQNRQVDVDRVNALARNCVEPDVDALSDKGVAFALDTSDNVGKKRKFIQRAIDTILRPLK